MRLVHSAFEKVLPGFEQLREDASADYVDVDLGADQVIHAPIYDQDIGTPIRVGSERPFTTRSGRNLGYRATFITMVDGIPYSTHVKVPHDELRSEFEVNDFNSSAWMTQFGSGYTENPNARIFARTLNPQMEMGPPASDNTGGFIRKLFKVPATLAMSQSLPLSYIAQAEQGIAARIAETNPHMNIPKLQVKRGKSRGANLSSGHVPYAQLNGADIVAMRNMGRCAPDKITIADLPEFLAWITMTGLGGLAASACLIKDGQIGSIVGTTSFNPDFLAANLTGTTRALASGETGAMIDWTPRDMFGSEVLYGLDSLSRADEIVERLSDRPNVKKKIVLGGTHGALLHPLAHEGEVLWMDRFTEQYRKFKGQMALMDQDYINNVTEPSLIEEAVA